MRFRTLFLLCISFVGAIIIVLSVTSDNSKTLRANIIASVSTTSMLPRVKDRVTITNPYSIKPNTTSSTPTTPLQENYNLKRNFCSMKFKNGDMCPPLYTDLGGKCVRNETDYLDCTDVRRLGSHSLRQAQLAITRMLGLFDNIARKYDIKYWITSATLLGAARHKGFIPWDSDADIEITLDNYERFFRDASAELPEDVFFQNTESDHYLKPDTKTYEAHKYKDIGMYIRTWNPRLRDRKSCYKYCMAMACKWHDGLMIDMYVVEESESAGAYPLKELLFEGLSLPVQNNWKDVLKSKYGDDYMVVPDEGSKNRQQWDWPDPDHSCEELASQKR